VNKKDRADTLTLFRRTLQKIGVMTAALYDLETDVRWLITTLEGYNVSSKTLHRDKGLVPADEVPIPGESGGGS
jgi:hypothetical protein